MEKLIHIDTHVAVWLYSGLTEKFSKKALELLEERSIVISPIVELEIEYLFEVKKIKQNSSTILRLLEKDFGLQVLDVDFRSVIAGAINFSWTRDPFDRMIAATALTKRSLLLTKDTIIRANCDFATWDK